MSQNNDFGDFLRSERVKSGLSLRKLAGILGLSHVYLGEVERGISPPLDRKWWPLLITSVPSISVDALERKLATTRPLQLDISDSPPAYQNLAMALARKIEKEDLPKSDLREILRLLEGTKRE